MLLEGLWKIQGCFIKEGEIVGKICLIYWVLRDYPSIDILLPCSRFAELMNGIPDDVKADWYFENILDKLAKYGQVW